MLLYINKIILNSDEYVYIYEIVKYCENFMGVVILKIR